MLLLAQGYFFYIFQLSPALLRSQAQVPGTPAPSTTTGISARIWVRFLLKNQSSPKSFLQIFAEKLNLNNSSTSSSGIGTNSASSGKAKDGFLSMILYITFFQDLATAVTATTLWSLLRPRPQTTTTTTTRSSATGGPPDARRASRPRTTDRVMAKKWHQIARG